MTRGKSIRLGILSLLLATCAWQLWPEVHAWWPRPVGTDEVLIRVSRDGLWGYINQHGHERIPLQWASVSNFNTDGWAQVLRDRQSGKWMYDVHGRWVSDDTWGFINRQGQVVIEPQWEWVEDFDKDGYALVQRDGKGGVIDRHGRVVVKPQWGHFREYWIANKERRQHNGLWDWVDQKKHLEYEPDWKNLMSRLSPIESGGKYGYADWQGEIVLEPRWDDAREFDEDGLAQVELDDQWGWINRHGQVVIEPQYGQARGFDEFGLAQVQCGDISSGLWGWIDRQGHVAIEVQWSSADDFYGTEMAKVKRNGKWGWIDRMGRIVIKPEWEDAQDFGSDGWVRVKRDGKWGWIDQQGRVVIEPLWEANEYFDPNGWARVKHGGRWGWIDRQGLVVIEPRWAEAEPFNATGMASVSTAANTDRHYDGIGSHRFNFPEPPPQFRDTVSRYPIPWEPQRQGGVWGLINRQGQVVIEPQWNYCDETVTHQGKSWYVLSALHESSLRRAWARLPAWVPRPPLPDSHRQTACYDSTGRMIWSSDDRFHRRLIAGACATILFLSGVYAGIRKRRATGAYSLASKQLPTPEGARPVAQGCSRSELPWGMAMADDSTPTGLRRLP